MDQPLYRCDLCLEWKVTGNSSYYHWSGEPDMDGFCCPECAVLGLQGQMERYNKSREHNLPPYTNGYLRGKRNEHE